MEATSIFTLAGLLVALLSLLVLGGLGRAATNTVATAPDVPRRAEMRWGAKWLPVIIFVACAMPAAIGLLLIPGGSTAAIWLIALAVAAMGVLMIAQRFIYWQFAGLGMATPEAIERTDSGAVDWEIALDLARGRQNGWVSRLLLPLAGLIIAAGAIILPMLILPAERELEFAEWLWGVDDEIEFATQDLGRPQVWTDIGFEPKRSNRDYKRPSDGGRVKLSYFDDDTTDEQVRTAIAITQRILEQSDARGRWQIIAITPAGDEIEVVFRP